MRKVMNFIEKVAIDLGSLFFGIALLAASLGCSIWAVKWVLKLLGVI